MSRADNLLRRVIEEIDNDEYCEQGCNECSKEDCAIQEARQYLECQDAEDEE